MNRSISSEYQSPNQVYPPITPKWTQNGGGGNNGGNLQNSGNLGGNPMNNGNMGGNNGGGNMSIHGQIHGNNQVNMNQPPGLNSNRSIGLLSDPQNLDSKLDLVSGFNRMNLNQNNRQNNNSSLDGNNNPNLIQNMDQNSLHAQIQISKRPDRLEVCRDALRKNCHRGETDCKYAHPRDTTQIDPSDNTVIVCMDSIKKRCSRDHCKYYHPPSHLQQRVKLMQQQQQAGPGGVNGQITNFNPTAFINSVAGQATTMAGQGMMVSKLDLM